MKYLKFIRIFLLVLIVFGIALLATQKIWVPKLVNKIILHETPPLIFQIEAKSNFDNKIVKEIKNIQSDTFDWCIENGGNNLTPNYNAPKVCNLNNRIYEESCVSNDKYFVVEEGLTGDAGSNHLIKYKNSENQNFDCKYIFDIGDFEIKNDWAEYTVALENNFLILDSGTSPYPRGLIIYDLNIRKNVYNDSYSGINSIQNNTIDYWTGTNLPVTVENCPESKTWWDEAGLGSAIESRVSLNLSTLTKIELGEYRCSPRQ